MVDIAEIFRKARINTHDPSRCVGEYCTLHNPSDHHMVEWSPFLRSSGLVERICPHDVGHPDPDSLAWLIRAWEEQWPEEGKAHGKSFGVHGCDGCCRPVEQEPFSASDD